MDASVRRHGLVLVAVGAAAVVVAGPLDPPTGPVAPTFKTLFEVEPRIAISSANTPGDSDSLYKITQPGSYYVTGKITGVAGKHGIEIAASGVTVDLNGFDLVGTAGMGDFDGVSVSVDSLRNITVRNGAVRSWGGTGVDLGFVSHGCFIEGVLSSGNAVSGFSGAVSCTITNCTASFNTQSGIRANNGSKISGCTIYSNGGSGIQVNFGCTILDSSVYLNGAGGIFAADACNVADCSAYTNTGNGIRVGEGSTVSGCTSRNNTLVGVWTGQSSTVSNCSATWNDQEGIRVLEGSTVVNCNAAVNGFSGILAVRGSTITGCSVRSNGVDGIETDAGCVVSACTALENQSHGIAVQDGCRVTDCTSRINSIHGIMVNGDGGLISGNTSSGNGTAASIGSGVNVFGTRVRVEDNNCAENNVGIQVVTSGNILLRNTCSANSTNWIIVANNVYGPILDRRAPGSGAVNGNSAGDSTGTTHPNANFSY